MGANQQKESMAGVLRPRGPAFRRERVPEGPDSPGLAGIERSTPAPRFAMVIVTAVFTCYLTMHVVNIMEATTSTPRRLFSLVALAGIAALQFAHTAPRAHAFRTRYGVWTLAAQAALTLGPNIAFGVSWGAMGGFVAGSALIVLPLAVGWPVFVGVVTVVGVAGAQTPGLTVPNIVYLFISTTLCGLVVYSLTRLNDLVTAIFAAREELARMAVARERLRFARDLHDLLGYSLSSITLKSELIYRLIGHNPERAKDEVTGVLEVSRQALSDVREVARGYRDMSLLAEAGSARAVLEAADVEARIRISCRDLSNSANTVLATVLREGVTNLLRHSQAKVCHIDVTETDGHVQLSVVNDGVAAAVPADGADGRPGTGLESLTARVEALGGRLSAGPDSGGVFRLVAAVPATAPDESDRDAPGRSVPSTAGPLGRRAIA